MNLRNLVIWGAILVVMVGLYGMMAGGNRTSNQTEVTYSQLLAKVNAGEIKAVEIEGPMILATDQGNRAFTSVTPNNQDDLVQRLEKQGADIKVDDAKLAAVEIKNSRRPFTPGNGLPGAEGEEGAGEEAAAGMEGAGAEEGAPAPVPAGAAPAGAGDAAVAPK